MAKINLNSALKGIRGMIDGWVYKKSSNGVILTRRPVHDGPPTAGQVAQRDQFRLASEFAVSALADPTLRAFYERAGAGREPPIKPYAAALGDYFTAPVVTKVDVTGYHGVIGDKIAVSVTPSVEATGLTVTIRNVPAAGETPAVVETGAAALVDGKWVYTTTAAAPAGHAVTIEAKATDHAGNERSLTAQWSG